MFLPSQSVDALKLPVLFQRNLQVCQRFVDHPSVFPKRSGNEFGASSTFELREWWSFTKCGPWAMDGHGSLGRFGVRSGVLHVSTVDILGMRQFWLGKSPIWSSMFGLSIWSLGKRQDQANGYKESEVLMRLSQSSARGKQRHQTWNWFEHQATIRYYPIIIRERTSPH